MNPNSITIIDRYPPHLLTAMNKNNKYFYCVINIEPLSKSNHLMRGPNGIMYIPKKFKDWDKEVKKQVREAMDSLNKPISDCPLIIQIDGYYPTKRVVDAPNLSKSLCDALNDVVYYDDRQIISCITTKSYDKIYPRIEILITGLDIEHPLVNLVTLKDKVNQ